MSWEVLRPRKDILEIRIMSSSALASIKVSNTTNLTNFRPKEIRKVKVANLGRRTITMGERKARRERRATRNCPM